jgi:hypothetical protein
MLAPNKYRRNIFQFIDESVKVRQQRYPSDCPFAKGICWKWFADFRWQFYDVLTSNFIEDEFQQKSNRVNLRRSPIRLPNVIYFSNMEQVNKKTKFSRKIEREETKEQYPQANHETANMTGQHGFTQGYNQMLSSVSSRVITHTSAVQPVVQSYNPVLSNGSNTSTYTNGNLGSLNSAFSAVRPHSSNTNIQTVTQSYNPVMPNNNITNINGNLGSFNSPFRPVIPHSNNTNIQTFTSNYNPLMPNGSTNTTHTNSNLGNLSSPFMPVNPGFGTVPHNTNRLTHFGVNPSSNHMGTSTMTNNNQTGLTMHNTSPLYHTRGQLPVGHTPPRLQNGGMNSNYGASLIGGASSQTNSSSPVASSGRRKQARRANALSPTSKSACKNLISLLYIQYILYTVYCIQVLTYCYTNTVIYYQ